MAWITVLTDLKGVVLSHLTGASGRELTLGVNTMGTATLTVPVEHDDADLLLNCRTLLKVYERVDEPAARTAAAAARTTAPGPVIVGGDKILHFVGRQITAEEVAGASGRPTIACTFADAMWTMSRRVVGDNAEHGYWYPSLNNAANLADVATIISDIVSRASGQHPPGLKMGTFATGSTSTQVLQWYFKNVGEAIAELCATLDGPDWKVRAIEPALYAAGYEAHPFIFGELNVYPTIGQHRADAIFEYGTGALNVGSYRRAVTIEDAANHLWHLPPGFPDNVTQSPFLQEDQSVYTTDGKLTAVVQADIKPDDFRTKLLRHHLAVRKSPRQIITFEPVRDPSGERVPRLGVDFDVGDTLPFRATVSRFGTLVQRLNVTVRVYKAAISIDDQGAATTRLTVTPT